MARCLPAAWLLCSAVVLPACGASPTAPSPTPSFTAIPAGSWTGTTRLGTCAPATGAPPGVTLDICVSAGSVPITLLVQQTGEAIEGEINYQGLRLPVSGRLTGRVMRLEGGIGLPATGPGEPRVEIRAWQTRFVSAHEMAGAFTLVTSRTTGGVPAVAAIDVQVTSLVRSGSA